MYRYLIIGILIILLAGCSTAPNLDNDPRSGGFFGGLAGVTRGDYKARQAERESALASVRGANMGLQQDNQALEQDRQRKQAEVARLKQQVAQLDDDIGSLSAKVAVLNQHGGSSQVTQLKQRVSELEHKTSTLKTRAENADTPALVKEKERLEKEYNAALQTYLVMSDAGGSVGTTAVSSGLSDFPR
ncbi:hypothetical protein CKO25_17985 [Thiocapsa imhoffii]|uniref:Lipoprotein n=1 Tax=Thiocapsa imhoffii TaxID=382777 RepID=A0A9X0WKN6_9GAMM|nr:hypothetical protein [Thiocapsa imhoffii]MBK1646501.1 hypothetical protein [Thiocapsa imhoffii]